MNKTSTSTRNLTTPCAALPRALQAALGAVALTAGLAASAQGAEGEALFAPCTACHGADGAGNPGLGAPALAGQLEDYLARQLQIFRRGIRGTAEGDTYGAQMQPFASQLPDDEAVAVVAAYLAAMTPPAPVGAGEGDPRRGASLYNGNCGACHGGQAEGNDALKAPRLAGLDRAYLERQLAHFRNGIRGGNAEDRLGRQMAMMAGTLAEGADTADLLSYIGTLGAAEATGD